MSTVEERWSAYPAIPGAFWPCASGGDYSRAWVEKVDDEDTFTSDDDAARGVARITGWPLRWAPFSPYPGTTYAAPYVQPVQHDHHEPDPFRHYIREEVQR